MIRSNDGLLAIAWWAPAQGSRRRIVPWLEAEYRPWCLLISGGKTALGGLRRLLGCQDGSRFYCGRPLSMLSFVCISAASGGLAEGLSFSPPESGGLPTGAFFQPMAASKAIFSW